MALGQVKSPIKRDLLTLLHSGAQLSKFLKLFTSFNNLYKFLSNNSTYIKVVVALIVGIVIIKNPTLLLSISGIALTITIAVVLQPLAQTIFKNLKSYYANKVINQVKILRKYLKSTNKHIITIQNKYTNKESKQYAELKKTVSELEKEFYNLDLYMIGKDILVDYQLKDSVYNLKMTIEAILEDSLCVFENNIVDKKLEKRKNIDKSKIINKAPKVEETRNINKTSNTNKISKTSNTSNTNENINSKTSSNIKISKKPFAEIDKVLDELESILPAA